MFNENISKSKKKILFQKYPYFLCMSRSMHRRWSVRKGALTNFSKFTGKHLCQSLFLNKVAGLGLRFPVNFAKFPKTTLYRSPLDDCFCTSTFFNQFWKSFQKKIISRIIFRKLLQKQQFTWVAGKLTFSIKTF